MDILGRILFYYATFFIGFALMTAVNLLRCKKYDIGRIRAIVYTILTFVYGILGAMLIGDIYNIIAASKGIDTDIQVELIGAVVFMLLWIPTVYIEKQILKIQSKKEQQETGKKTVEKTISFRNIFDFITPGAFTILSCIKFGCFIRGCCFGIECSWGVHSLITGTTVFPIQILESLNLCLVIAITYFVKQTKFYRRGMSGPLSAAMFIFARFFWEFLRYNPPELRHFFLGMTIWQIMCIIVFAIVFVWVIVLYKTQPSEPMPKGKIYLAMERKILYSKNQKKKANKNKTTAKKNVNHKGNQKSVNQRRK